MRKLFALLAAVCLFAAACGSAVDVGDASNVVAEAVAVETTEAPTETTEAPETTTTEVPETTTTEAPAVEECAPLADADTDTVAAIQAALSDAGFDIGPNGVDGVYGADTIAAIEAAKTVAGIGSDVEVCDVLSLLA